MKIKLDMASVRERLDEWLTSEQIKIEQLDFSSKTNVMWFVLGLGNSIQEVRIILADEISKALKKASGE